MPSSFKQLNSTQWRDYYEEQGIAAQNGEGISCSEKTTNDVVIEMATEYASEYETLLDIGCGANLIYDQAIAELGKQVVGVDFTFNFLKLAPRDSRVRLTQGDATKLPFYNAAFDAAICSETLEHIPDDEATVCELARVIRPQGWLFLTVPNLWNAARIMQMIKHLDPRVHLMTGHLREYSLKKVSNLLAGRFEIKKVYSVGFGWEGSRFGGRIEQLIKQGTLSSLTKSVAVVARKV